jgi:hypothetical protein
MKYHKQSKENNKINGARGDCYQTVLACILNKEKSEVPDFNEGFPTHQEFTKRINQYLHSQNLASISVHIKVDTFEELLQCFKNQRAVYIVGGISPRQNTHYVIACGNKMIHDPHPKGGGLIKAADTNGYMVDILSPFNSENL